MKQFGACRLDTRNQCLWRDGVLLSIPPKPYAVLLYLVEHPDQLITHDELMEALWPETYVQPQVLRTYVLELRKLLGDDAGNPRFIATIPKRGYRFLAPVTEVAQPDQRETGRQEVRYPTANGKTSAQPNTDESLAAEPTEIVGRDEELRKLHSLMKRACAGERQIVFISGDAGMGKTALVDAFCAEGCDGARVARGQSVERFAGREPYYAVKELLSELCGSEKGERTRRLLARIAPGWSNSLPDRTRDSKSSQAATHGTADDPGALTAPMPGTREQTLREICEALEAMAAESPLLLAFEDVQWADEATHDLFSALARRRSTARLMLIATCRPATATHAEDAKDNSYSLRTLKQDLLVRRLCTAIVLEPLKRPAVAEYLSRELSRRHPAFTSQGDAKGDPGTGALPASTRKPDAAGPPTHNLVPAGLPAYVHQQSIGIPLFMTAILDHLIARHDLVQTPTGWHLRVPLADLDPGVPDSLREMIELETDALKAADHRLLEAASVVGTVFPVWAAAAVLALNPADPEKQHVEEQAVEEQYEALARRVHFLHPAGHDELPDGTRSTSYVFAHAFYREVLYQRQPEVRRSRGHQRVAEALSRIFAGSEASVASEIVSHYERGGNWKRAAETILKMAESSTWRDRPAEQARLLNHALELIGNLGQKERTPLERELRQRLDAPTKQSRNAAPPLGSAQRKAGSHAAAVTKSRTK